MNRLLKKLFALAGAMILILALAAPAFARENSFRAFPMPLGPLPAMPPETITR